MISRINKNPYILKPLLIFFCLLPAAWTDSWNNIKKCADGIKSMTSDFTQKKHMKILSRPLVSEGKLFYISPKTLRWEYSSPVKSILIMNESSVHRYIVKDTGYETDRSVNLQAMRIVLDEITGWLNGRFEDNPGFTAELEKKKPGRIILTPREQSLSKTISRIVIEPSKEPGVIEKITIYESSDSCTVIEFKNVKLNSDPDRSLFMELK